MAAQERRSPGRGSAGKRGQIQDAAARLFLAQGYAATSMDGVAAEAQVSKATLYAHFKSKQILFESMVQERFRTEMEENLQPAQLGDDPLEGLTAVGRRFLNLLLAFRAMGTFRIVLAESHRLPELGEAFYRSGPARTLQIVTTYIEHLNRLGRLTVPDPVLGADLFLGMLKTSRYLKCLLGIAQAPEDNETEALAAAAAKLFVAAHSPQTPKK
jgi:AcrR family transcriptional regulator